MRRRNVSRSRVPGGIVDDDQLRLSRDENTQTMALGQDFVIRCRRRFSGDFVTEK